MEKLELSCNANQEIVEAIKRVLLRLYPQLDNRMDMLFDEDRCVDIVLTFIKDKKQNNKEYTHIYFMDGTSSSQSNTRDSINVEGLINQETIFNLIQFLLSDHDCILKFQKESNEMVIEFDVNMCDENMQGMGCRIIRLEFQFRNYPNHENLLDNYFISLFRRFSKELQRTHLFKEEYQKYCIRRKQEIINSLSEEELHSIIGLLTNQDLCNILLAMSNERFAELYNEYEQRKENKKRELVKKENELD